MSAYRAMLQVGGFLNLLVAAAHLALPFFAKPNGPLTVSPYFETHRLVFFLAAAGIAAVAAIFGLYGLSGGGRIRRLPFLRTGLIFVGVLFLLDLVNMALRQAARGGWQSLSRPSIAPLALLTIGLLYLAGTIGRWKELRPERAASESSGSCGSCSPSAGTGRG
jgi:hypothetical protein